MGKRKHNGKEEEIDRKIRKLERKKLKLRRKYYCSDSSSESHYGDVSDYVQPDPLQEDSQYEETPEGNHNMDLANALHSESGTELPAPTKSVPLLPPVTALTSVVNPVNQASTSTEVLAQSSAEPIVELEPEILNILGDEPIREEKLGPCIQKDLASRWSDILVNGLKNETKKEIINKFEVPENLKLIQAPVLNAEIKAASNENSLKRDNILMEKQKLLASAITNVANTMSTLLTADFRNNVEVNKILKPLSDAGRLLCHIHFSETVTRRTFLLPTLNKEVKENVKDLKRDGLLFGNELQEKLKSMKALSKTGAELKPAMAKPKPQPRNKPSDASTSRALNWRGAPATAAPPPPPRRTQAKQNSSSGGRKQPPPPRRANDHRAPPRHQGRGPRR